MFKDYVIECQDNELTEMLMNKFFNTKVELKTKARKEKASFDGTSVSYEDLCSFKVYKEKDCHIFIPILSRMSGKKLSQNHKVVDLTSVINVGIAECFMVLRKYFGTGICDSLLEYMASTYPIINDDETYLRLMFMNSSNMNDYTDLLKDNICIEHLNHVDFMYRFKKEDLYEISLIEKITNYLYSLATFNGRAYAVCISDLISFLMFFKNILFDLEQRQVLGNDKEETIALCKRMVTYKGLVGTAGSYYNRFFDCDYEGLVERPFPVPHYVNLVDELKFGSIPYKYKDNSGRVSDARQFAIALTGLLGYGLYSCNSGTKINFIDLDYIQYKLNNCLGDDFFNAIATGVVTELSVKTYKDWRCDYPEICDYENYVVWRRKNKSTLKWEEVEHCCLASKYADVNLFSPIYDNTDNLQKTLISKLNKSDSVVEKLNKEISRLKDCIADKSKKPTIDDSVIKVKDEEIEELKKRIEELERINESKSDIIANKSEEIASLNNEIAKIFNDDYEPVTESEDVSFEDKVSFLNDFSFVFVNGLIGFEQTLRGIGLNNYKVISTCGTSSNISTSYKADFVILCTNFVSHAMCNSVKSVYETQAECCYYSGTNIDKMIDFLYDYVKNFLEA